MGMGGGSPIGRWYEAATGHALVFTFDGLLVASLIFNLPFAIQPVQRALESIPEEVRHAAACCGMSRLRTVWRIELPLAWPGILSALVMTFAHTLGEFGVVLMVGGNIPGVTRTISIDIYDQVQAANYSSANQTALALLVISFVLLSIVYGMNRRSWVVGPWK
jgi:molybdate transport system permease protein